MKNFFQFLIESAAQQAARLGLEGDGHGGWYKDGEFVAKTDKGRLKFYNKRQRVGQQDPPQTDKEKNLSHSTSAPAPEQPVAQQAPAQEGPPAVEKTKGTLTVAFGRFNPPTTGHEKLLDTVAANSDEGDYIIIPSRSQDKKKNPLDADMKVSVMRQMFPQHSERIVNDPQNRTIFDVLKKAHMDGYAGVRIVGGGDRVAEFEKLSGNYNGKLYQFDNLEVLSAGDRDPDGDDVSGMSASKQRKAAAEGDFTTFRKGVPSSLNAKQTKELYNNIRAAMNIKEGWSMWEIAPKFDWKSLREHFVGKKIFKVGEVVESLNTGLVGKIIRRGTNHLICVTEDDIMFKSWIKDVQEAVVNGTEKSGVPANQREIGTDAHRKYVETMVPGSNWGRNFINKYKKK
jgi:hypothetical protein